MPNPNTTMHTQIDSPATALMVNLRHVSDWLSNPNLAAAWVRPQGEKWTIEQEFAHLLRSTYGIVQLFGEPGRAVWRPTDRPSRPYDEVVGQYKAALPMLPPNTNAAVATAEPKPLATQTTAWQQTLAAIETILPALTDADLTGNTVWKHPLIGPLTGLEMLYFSTYHTERHLESLSKKVMSDKR